MSPPSLRGTSRRSNPRFYWIATQLTAARNDGKRKKILNEIETIHILAQSLGEALIKRHLILATAESCTGGWIAQVLTSIAGSSSYFERGFVTYSNAAKQEMLGVSEKTLIDYGAVSEQVATEMAQGALLYSHACVSVAVTGIAGPNGGTSAKPVGTVWFGFAGPDFSLKTAHQLFSGDRTVIRLQAVEFALATLLKLIEK